MPLQISAAIQSGNDALGKKIRNTPCQYSKNKPSCVTANTHKKSDSFLVAKKIDGDALENHSRPVRTVVIADN